MFNIPSKIRLKSIHKHKSRLFLSFVVLTQVCIGQAVTNPRKSIFLEIAGSGGLGSMNYEQVLFKKKHTEFTWRAGLSLAPIDKNNGTGIVVPLMMNAIISKNSHKLELGLGQGITPLISYLVDVQMQQWGGVSIGYTLNHPKL
jgi:hypothetical protein